MKYYAVRFNDYNTYLVEVEDDNQNYINDIEIDKKTYEEMLKANQEKSAEIRVVRKNNKTTISDFYDRKPSEFHHWNEEKATWDITEENEQEIAEREREAERAKLMQEMQYHMLLGEEDKAREIALKIKELDA